MKNVLYLLVLIVLTSCNQSNDEQTPNDSTSGSARSGDINNDEFIKRKKSFNKNNQPFEELTTAQAYVSHFLADSLRLRELQGNDANGPVTSVWLDAVTIDHFYRRIADSGCNGMRIYFGKYNTAVADPIRDGKFEGQNINNKYTLILVSTRSGTVSNMDAFSKDAEGYYHGLYNYNDPCPPGKNCVGADLLKATK